MVTDGVTESMDADREMFGQERLNAIVSAHSRDSISSILANIHQQTADWRDSRTSFDDITTVVLRWRGSRVGD